MSQVLFVVRGVQASGKSTFAKKWVSEKPLERARVNRDDERFSMFGKYVLPPELETKVTAVEHAKIEALLAAGMSVIVDSMNLRAKYLKPLLKMASRHNVTVMYKDFPVELDEALRRNASRDRVVPEEVLRKTYASFIRKGSFPKFPILEDFPVGFSEYISDDSLPTAYIVDIDGTLAHMHDRGPFDWDKVINDLPNVPVIRLVKDLKAAGHNILVTSGRDASCRQDTSFWLKFNGIDFDELFMRPEGNMEKDVLIKGRIFDENIRHSYNVLGAIDDRLQVCELWHEIGVPLFRVGDPNANF